MMINLIGYPETSLQEKLKDWGEAPYRARQVFQWLYRHQCRDISEMSNLSKQVRQKLQEHFTIRLPRILSQTQSKDGSIKFLFEVDGGAQVESIWMPDESRKTLCISSQVGCRLACSFCLTGTLGLKEQLKTGDILGQFMAVNEVLPEADHVTNIVMMGMGEPLDNYDAVVDAIRILISPTALAFPMRKVTLSTSGLVDKLSQFGKENLAVNLAVSLNASDNPTRDEIMPINRKYPIEALMTCLHNYPLKNGRRITMEYVMLKGINDRMEDAQRLARLLQKIPCKINLIPFNWYEGSDYHPPPHERVREFQDYLISKHFTTFIRKNRGTDILGACGQLAAQSFPQPASL